MRRRPLVSRPAALGPVRHRHGATLSDEKAIAPLPQAQEALSPPAAWSITQAPFSQADIGSVDLQPVDHVAHAAAAQLVGSDGLNASVSAGILPVLTT